VTVSYAAMRTTSGSLKGLLQCWRLAAGVACCLLACEPTIPKTDSPAPPVDSASTAASSAVAAASVAVREAAGVDGNAFEYDAELFEKKRKARPGDWLDRFPQTGLTFDEYSKMDVVRVTEQRNKIVLQPLGEFRDDKQLGHLQVFTAAFFDTPTTVAKPQRLPKKGIRTRTQQGRTFRQAHAGKLLDYLGTKLPDDAVCLLGVTMTDLYPEPSWNYVFGQASLDERVGVYSLARYYPGFWNQTNTAAARRKAVLRSFKVLAHETGHMFSMPHCVRYECVMNGSNSLEEMDRSPAHLCPQCLKMLQWNLRFDVRKRYERLREIYRRDGLEEQAAWLDRRLAKLGPSR
jgi:archaemetzincin